MRRRPTPPGAVRRWVARTLTAGLCVSASCADPTPRQVAGGNPSRGPQLIREYACHACHMIPGVKGADGLVGPPLVGWGGRAYIAGHLPNTPENLIRWIRDPEEFESPTAMPDMGVTEADARDIAAYLFTLR